MEENKFWLILWATLGSLFVVIIISLLTAAYHTEKHIMQMVQSGANPIEAKCAVGSYNTGLCEMYQVRIAASSK
jgi:hypothetical protein